MKTRRGVVTVDLTAKSENESRSRRRSGKRPAEDVLKVSPKKKIAKNNLHDRMKNNLSKLLGKSPQDNSSFICEDPNLISFRQELMSEIQITNPDLLFVKLEGNVPYDEAMTIQKNPNLNNNSVIAQNKTHNNKANKISTLRSSQNRTKNNNNTKKSNISESQNKTRNISSLIKFSDLRANVAKKCANNSNTAINNNNNNKISTIINASQTNDTNNMRQSVRLRFRNDVSKANKYQVTNTPNTSASSPIAVANLRQKVMAKCTNTSININPSPYRFNKNTYNNSNVFVNIRQSIIEKCRLGIEKNNPGNKNQSKTPILPNTTKVTTNISKVQTRTTKENIKEVTSTVNKRKVEVTKSQTTNVQSNKNKNVSAKSRASTKKNVVKIINTERNVRSSVRRSKRTPHKKIPDGKSSR